MLSFSKTLVAITVVVLLSIVGIAWVMGKNFTPWVATAKLSAREKLEQMVDRYKYELTKSEDAVAKARERVEQLRKASAQANVGMRRLENESKLAEVEIANVKAQLSLMEKRIEAGQEVRLASGRNLTNDEIRLRVQDQGQRLQLAQQKMTFLDDMCKRRQERKQKLAEARRQAPTELARLELSVRHLAEKVKLYESQKALMAEEQEAEASMSKLFDHAQKTLEDAHGDLDAKLAQFDALFEPSLEALRLAAAGSEDGHAQQIVADIRKILAKDPPGSE